MGITQCSRCGGQISTNSTNCPWCGHNTSLNSVGPLLVVALLLVGVSFGTGLIRWGWLEQALGLDRGFVQQTASETGAGGGGESGGDLSWRLPPGPDPANNYDAGGSGGGAGDARRVTVADRPAVEPARVTAVVRSVRKSAPAAATAPVNGCADSSAVGRLIASYPAWSNSDLVLIACGGIRSGFSAAQVRTARGRPATVRQLGQNREQWEYADLKVILEQGQVISFGQ